MGLDLEHEPVKTGRVFLCLENEDEYLDMHTHHFIVGKDYHEAESDSFGDKLLDIEGDSLIMISETNLRLYVKADNFILLDRRK